MGEIKITTKEFLESVSFMVINAEKNQELLSTVPHRLFLLSTVPHRLFLDLEAIYVSRIPLPCQDSNKGYIAMTLNWNMALDMGLTEQMLYEAAKKYMPAATMESFEICIQSIVNEIPADERPKQLLIPNSPMYIASNKEHFYGASALLDVEIFRKLAEEVNDDLFILPSSIHEVIVLPSTGFSVSELEEMVRDVNQKMVSDDKRLSDKVYWYSRKTNTITIAGKENVALVDTEAVEICPYCECENVFTNWDASKQGYIAKCWNCGKEIFLCDECHHSDDNPKRKCDWHEKDGCGKCFRGVTHNGGEDHD